MFKVPRIGGCEAGLARRLVLAAMAFGLGACDLVGLGDALTRDLTPAQAAVCRQAVAEEVARQGIDEDQVRRIHYQRISLSQHGAVTKGAGYEAWVYPKKEGPGALVIELSGNCQVRGFRYHQPERDSGET